jgi:anti-anti-sigma factor
MAFNSDLTIAEGIATIRLSGELDAVTAPDFHRTIENIAALAVHRLVISLHELTYISSAGLRSLVFARQNMDEAVSLVMAGAGPMVERTIRMAGLDLGIELRND